MAENNTNEVETNQNVDKNAESTDGEALKITESSNGEVQKNSEDTEKNNKTSDSEKTDAKNSHDLSPTLLGKIKKQVEFYFGDVNMQKDKFLIEQTKLDDGWVPMSVMLNFKILASLSKDIDVILKALENSELIEIADDKKKIRRKLEKPLPLYNEEYRKAQEARTIYLKGFPADTTMEILKDHFENDNIENIVMRKYKKDKEFHFKGSIFLQFKTLDDAKKFMAQESVKYKDTDLIKLWAADYLSGKEKEKEDRRQNKEKNLMTKMNKNAKDKQKNQGQCKLNIPKGSVIHFTDIQKDLTREDIKEKLAEFNVEIAYIDYNTGDKEGWIRLQGENSANELLEKLEENKLKVKESNLQCKPVEGEEEQTYFTKIEESMAAHRNNRRDKGRNLRKGFKRRRSPQREESSKKIHLDN